MPSIGLAPQVRAKTLFRQLIPSLAYPACVANTSLLQAGSPSSVLDSPFRRSLFVQQNSDLCLFLYLKTPGVKRLRSIHNSTDSAST